MKITVGIHAKLIVCALALSISTGCAQINRSATYSQQNHTQRTDRVEFGTVVETADITIQGSSRGMVGAGVGAVAGGILGGKVGGGSGRKLATLAGAAAGGAAGQRIEQMAGNRRGQELTVQLESGRYVSVTQQTTNQQLRPGDRVRLVSGSVSRVLQ